MVQRVACFPTEEELALLQHLKGALGVIYSTELAMIATAAGLAIHISADAYDVRTKFEFGALRIAQGLPRPGPSSRRMDSCTRVDGLFRFEWRRPVSPSRKKPGYSPWEGRFGPGRQVDVPDDVVAVALAMVGLVLYGEGPEPELCVTDDVMPTTVRVLAPGEAMAEAMGECDCVPLQDIPQWLQQFQTADSGQVFERVG